MKKPSKGAVNQLGGPPLYIGHQWGEPLHGESSLHATRVGEELEIVAAMPHYDLKDHPCDIWRQYSIARKSRSIGKQRTGKDSPHVRFANADSDDELIDFVRSFGPVVCRTSRLLPSTSSALKSGPTAIADQPFDLLIQARQNLSELRSEQRIYKAALNLVVELTKTNANYDFNHAREQIDLLRQGVKDWPRQRRREKQARGESPLWSIQEKSIRRIAALARVGRDPILPPQVAGRIVISELVNVFPSFVFPNPIELHSYLLFGIRPLLYGILNHEFLRPRDVGVCANHQCREFFEIERAGQRFCDDVCSRQQRQRDYWRVRGKKARKKRSTASLSEKLSNPKV